MLKLKVVAAVNLGLAQNSNLQFFLQMGSYCSLFGVTSRGYITLDNPEVLYSLWCVHWFCILFFSWHLRWSKSGSVQLCHCSIPVQTHISSLSASVSRLASPYPFYPAHTSGCRLTRPESTVERLLSNALQYPNGAVPVWSPKTCPVRVVVLFLGLSQPRSCCLWVLWLWPKWIGVHKTPGMGSGEVAVYFKKSSVSVMSTLSILSNVFGESFVSFSKAIFHWRKRKLAV